MGLNGVCTIFLVVVDLRSVVLPPLDGVGDAKQRSLVTAKAVLVAALDVASLSADVSTIVRSLALGNGKPPALLKSLTTTALVNGLESVYCFEDHRLFPVLFKRWSCLLSLCSFMGPSSRALNVRSNSCSFYMSADLFEEEQNIFFISLKSLSINS